MAQFSDDALRRYSRQILLREVGGRGQTRICQGHAVLVVGPGAEAIATVAAGYLTRAGVAQVTCHILDVAAASALRPVLQGLSAEAGVDGRVNVAVTAPPKPLPDAGDRALGLCFGAWQDDTTLPEHVLWAHRSRVGRGSPAPAPDGLRDQAALYDAPSHGHADAGQAMEIDAAALWAGSALALTMLQGRLSIALPAGVIADAPALDTHP